MLIYTESKMIKLNTFIAILLFPFMLFAQVENEIKGQKISTDSYQEETYDIIQDKSDNFWGDVFIEYGIMYHLKIDKTYSRLAKSGGSHYFSIGNSYVGNNAIRYTQFAFFMGVLDTRNNDVNKLSNFGGHANIKYLLSIPQKNKRFNFFIGGNLGIRAEAWFPKNSYLRYGWDVNLGLGLSTSIFYHITNRFYIRYDFDMDLFGILWRSPKNGQQLVTEEEQLENGLLSAAFRNPQFSHIFNTIYTDSTIKVSYKIFKWELYYAFSIGYKYIKYPLMKNGYEYNNKLGIVF